VIVTISSFLVKPLQVLVVWYFGTPFTFSYSNLSVSHDGRQAVVAEIRNDGREGLLRFRDDGHQEWFLWAEFHQAGKWRKK
jgi:hypothetical protein